MTHERDMDDGETRCENGVLVFLSPKYNDPRLKYVSENTEEEE